MPRVATASPNDINKIHPTPSKNKKCVRHHRHMIKYVLSKIKYEKPLFPITTRILMVMRILKEAVGERYEEDAIVKLPK